MNEKATAEKANLRDYLAAERTFLAWIRTGLALMGFGFVVARFGLFLQQFEIVQHQTITRTYELSLWFGTALITIGVMVNLASGIASFSHHPRLGAWTGSTRLPSVQAMGLALFLAVVELMLIYLISVRDPTR